MSSKKEERWDKQRIKRGFSDRDLWSFDYYLSVVISNGLKRLKKIQNGYPHDLTPKKWDKILDTIIYSFDIAKKFIDSDIHLYETDPDKRKEFRQFLIDFKKDRPKCKIRMITKREYEKYLKGWELFKEYFFYLWD